MLSGVNPKQSVPVQSYLITRDSWRQATTLLLLLGVCAIAIPTMLDVARESWAAEQGGHGPIVLAIGLWLLVRESAGIMETAQPGSPLQVALAFALVMPLYVVARVGGIVEIETAAMYALLLVVGAALWGGKTLRRLWFPLLFLLFAFPPPDALYAWLTQPLKLAVSGWATWLLYSWGYPVAESGVVIQIGAYEMLVAAACAGLNSLMALSALGLIYTYLRRGADWKATGLLLLFIVPIAVVANLARVLLLLLITFHFGEAAGQGFLHDLAGLTMFLVALTGVVLLDTVIEVVRRGYPSRTALARKGIHD